MYNNNDSFNKIFKCKSKVRINNDCLGEMVPGKAQVRQKAWIWTDFKDFLNSKTTLQLFLKVFCLNKKKRNLMRGSEFLNGASYLHRTWYKIRRNGNCSDFRHNRSKWRPHKCHVNRHNTNDVHSPRDRCIGQCPRSLCKCL